MFKAVITEKSIGIEGTMSGALTGLACYVEALKNNKVPGDLIKRQ